MLEDVSISALHAALNGLAARQSAVSDNVANVNTPFFTARQVGFENDLRQALADGSDPLSVSPTVSATTDAAGLTGNNVNLATQTTLGVDTNLRYELALRATGDRFTLLRSAIRG